jgi:hypothetical protein
MGKPVAHRAHLRAANALAFPQISATGANIRMAAFNRPR